MKFNIEFSPYHWAVGFAYDKSGRTFFITIPTLILGIELKEK